MRRVVSSKTAVAPPAVSPSPRKSVDRSVVARALSTPLPLSPSRPRSRSAARKARGKAPYILGALTALLLAAAAGVAVPHCQKQDCVAQARQAYGTAATWTNTHADMVAEWTVQQAGAAATRAGSLRSAATLRTAALAERARLASRVALDKYSHLVRAT